MAPPPAPALVPFPLTGLTAMARVRPLPESRLESLDVMLESDWEPVAEFGPDDTVTVVRSTSASDC
jgi:hypothetical protein